MCSVAFAHRLLIVFFFCGVVSVFVVCRSLLSVVWRCRCCLLLGLAGCSLGVLSLVRARSCYICACCLCFVFVMCCVMSLSVVAGVYVW